MKPRNKMEPWMFAGPALVVYIFIVILPILWSLTYSFTDWNGVGRMNFVGLGNYIKLFDDKTLWIAFRNNIFFMITGTVFQLVMGLVMAILLSSIVKGSNLLRVIYFIPCIVSSMAICKIFEKLLSVQPKGVLAAVTDLLGLAPRAFLSEPDWALTFVTLIDGYKFCGLYMVIFYSAFMNVSQDVLESAYLDGCNWFQQLIYIKFPLIKNIFFMVLIILVNGCLKGFDVSYILTKGGPGNASELVSTYMYKTAFSMSKFGYGSTLGVFIMIESLTAVGIVRLIQKMTADREEQG